ncbi:MAG: chemotaxis protein CheW [Gammaproteobacteria bacterium]
MTEGTQDQVQELYALLVPLAEERLIVPRACVAEVIGFSRPVPRPGSAAWLLGTVNWSGRMLPVISFEGACGRTQPEAGSRTRIVVFFAIGGGLEGGYYGVLTQGFPQLLRVNADALDTSDREWPDDSPVIAQPKLNSEYPLIPDLERVEQMLQHELVS